MIQHKTKFLNAFIQWTIIVGLIPLSIYIHKGFWNLFVVLTWFMFAVSIIHIILGIAGGICLISEEYKDKSDTNKAIEVEKIFANIFAMPLYRKKGADKVHAEAEQKFLDFTFMWFIMVWLAFNGHILLTLAWVVNIGSRGLMQIGLEAFDEPSEV